MMKRDNWDRELLRSGSSEHTRCRLAEQVVTRTQLSVEEFVATPNIVDQEFLSDCEKYLDLQRRTKKKLVTVSLLRNRKRK